MMGSSLARKLLLIAVALSTSAAAFQVTSPVPSRSASRTNFMLVTPLSMAADLDDENRVGPTERLLIAAKERRERGYVQEVGKTVLGDNLDGVRALVWSLYGATNYIFPALGAVFFLKMVLQLAGYDFYFDEAEKSFALDTLEHIRFAEAANNLVAMTGDVSGSDGIRNLM